MEIVLKGWLKPTDIKFLLEKKHLVDAYQFWSAGGFCSMNMSYLFLDCVPSVAIKTPLKDLLRQLVFHETKINELLKRLRATRYWLWQGSVCLACV